MTADLTDIVNSAWFVAVWVGAFFVVIAVLAIIMKGK
jgi:hypothetical protein